MCGTHLSYDGGEAILPLQPLQLVERDIVTRAAGRDGHTDRHIHLDTRDTPC